MERFSDFAKDELPPEGEKIKISEVLGKDIAVVAFRVQKSHFMDDGDEQKQYLMLQIEMNGNKHVLFTGSGVLRHQVEEYKDHLPFMTQIKKINRHYSFT